MRLIIITLFLFQHKNSVFLTLIYDIVSLDIRYTNLRYTNLRYINLMSRLGKHYFYVEIKKNLIKFS